jgi:hypothetical protein
MGIEHFIARMALEQTPPYFVASHHVAHLTQEKLAISLGSRSSWPALHLIS